MRFLTAASMLLLSASMASAATLSEINGRALVSKGAGFSPAAKGSALTPGDRIVVEGSGTAVVKFNDGCAHNLTSGTIFTVTKASPCTLSSVDAEKFRNRMGQSTTPPPPAGLGVGTLVIGGVVVAGGVLAVVATQNAGSNNNNTPAAVTPVRRVSP